MGMAVFLQKERNFSRRPQNWRSHFRPQNCGQKFYGNEDFFSEETPGHRGEQCEVSPEQAAKILEVTDAEDVDDLKLIDEKLVEQVFPERDHKKHPLRALQPEER